jgi:hypothetical protein
MSKNADNHRSTVSRQMPTRGGSVAWIETDPAGHLSLRCAGCGHNEYVTGLAPALSGLVNHATTCTRRP